MLWSMLVYVLCILVCIDVDAIYRMVHGVPQIFHSFRNASDMYEHGTRNPLVSLPPRVLCPFNAQGALHLPEAYFGLLLPCTVSGRVTDIWRSYITETILTYCHPPASPLHQRTWIISETLTTTRKISTAN